MKAVLLRMFIMGPGDFNQFYAEWNLIHAAMLMLV